MLDYCVYCEWDKDSELSNGDIITYSWDCLDEEAMEYFNVRLSYSDIQFTVSDLLIAKEINPFENIIIE